jgi:hypothetical protein
MNPRATRTLRGLAAGTVATLVAAASHGLGGGGLPGGAGLALALAFSVIVSIALTGRRLPVVRLAASIVLSQLAFHVVFSTLGGAGEVISSGHGHHGTVRVTTAAESVAHASPLMWFAHVVAAAATIVALVYGERALAAIASTARMLLSAILRPVIIVAAIFTRDHRPSRQHSLVPRAARDLVVACGLRGPPAALAA